MLKADFNPTGKKGIELIIKKFRSPVSTLHDIARINPQTLDEMHGVPGVGQYRLTHYGQSFLNALKS